MTPDVPDSRSLDAPELEEEALAFFQTVEAASKLNSPRIELACGPARFTLTLPPLGEGDRGIVYTLESQSLDLPAGPARCASRWPSSSRSAASGCSRSR